MRHKPENKPSAFALPLLHGKDEHAVVLIEQLQIWITSQQPGIEIAAFGADVHVGDALLS
jgi:hypothetical protein